MNLPILKARIAISVDFSAEERAFLLDAISSKTAAVLYTPGQRVEQLWAYLALGKHGEGLCVAPCGVATFPLIAADQARLERLRPIARATANVFREPIRLVKFTGRAELEVIEPVR